MLVRGIQCHFTAVDRIFANVDGTAVVQRPGRVHHGLFEATCLQLRQIEGPR